jgi:hypothetical protein
MSYERSTAKPLPLTFETLPKYAKFFAKYGKTPSQWQKEQDEKNISRLRQVDALQFSKFEKYLGSRHNLSPTLKTPKDEKIQQGDQDQEKMKTVTYFNTDLQKNVTVKIPVYMNIIPQKTGTNKEKDKYVLDLDEKYLLNDDDLYDVIDSYDYDYKGTGGGYKPSKSKNSFNKIKNLIKSGHNLEIKFFNNKTKFSNRQVLELLQIAINKSNFKGAEIISFYM